MMRPSIFIRVGTLAGLIIGLTAAWSVGTPQQLSGTVISGGLVCPCSGTLSSETCKSLAKKFAETDCTDTTTVKTCYSQSPDSGYCNGLGTVDCAADCKIKPNKEDCKPAN
jgi:hypothetical protein